MACLSSRWDLASHVQEHHKQQMTHLAPYETLNGATELDRLMVRNDSHSSVTNTGLDAVF